MRICVVVNPRSNYIWLIYDLDLWPWPLTLRAIFRIKKLPITYWLEFDTILRDNAFQLVLRFALRGEPISLRQGVAAQFVLPSDTVLFVLARCQLGEWRWRRRMLLNFLTVSKLGFRSPDDRAGPCIAKFCNQRARILPLRILQIIL